MSGYELCSMFAELTRPWVPGPDWGKIAKLVDGLENANSNVVDALGNRIAQQLIDKESKVVWLSLIVLEACMGYCPSKMAERASCDDIIKTLVKIVKKRYNPKNRMKPSHKRSFNDLCGNLAAKMVRDWGLAFSGNERLNFPGFYLAYKDLVKRKVVFPPTDLSSNIPRLEKGSKIKAGDQLRVSVSTNVVIPNEVTTLVNSTESAVTLLSDILKNLSRKEKIENNDIANEVVKQIRDSNDKLLEFVAKYMDHEKACARLLEVHDLVEKVLNNYQAACAGVPNIVDESDSSDEKQEFDDIDDATFQKQHIQPIINAQGNPFSDLLQNYQNASPQPSQIHTQLHHNPPQGQFNHPQPHAQFNQQVNPSQVQFNQQQVPFKQPGIQPQHPLTQNQPQIPFIQSHPQLNQPQGQHHNQQQNQFTQPHTQINQQGQLQNQGIHNQPQTPFIQAQGQFQQDPFKQPGIQQQQLTQNQPSPLFNQSHPQLNQPQGQHNQQQNQYTQPHAQGQINQQGQLQNQGLLNQPQTQYNQQQNLSFNQPQTQGQFNQQVPFKQSNPQSNQPQTPFNQFGQQQIPFKQSNPQSNQPQTPFNQFGQQNLFVQSPAQGQINQFNQPQVNNSQIPNYTSPVKNVNPFTNQPDANAYNQNPFSQVAPQQNPFNQNPSLNNNYYNPAQNQRPTAPQQNPFNQNPQNPQNPQYPQTYNMNQQQNPFAMQNKGPTNLFG